MKIVTYKDFKLIVDDLTWVWSHFKVGLDSFEELMEEIEDEQLRERFENNLTWIRDDRGLKKLDKIRNDIWGRGILNKGLRF